MRPACLRPGSAGAALVVLGCATAALRCAVYDATLLVPARIEAGAPPDAGTDAGIDADSLYHWPPRPTADDGTGDYAFALAMSDLGLELSGDAGTPVGFDLDNVDTCPGPESCKRRAATTTQCDDDGGIDNSAGKLFQHFAGSDLFTSSSFGQHMRSGDYSILIRILDYNGGANDTQVSVAVFVSSGAEGIETEGGVPTKPAFDGNDRWTVDPGSLIGGAEIAGQNCDATPSPCVPHFIDPRAYVTNHVLVATVDFPLSIGSGVTGTSTITITLQGSVLVGTLIPDGASFRINEGHVAGRWATWRFLTALSAVNDPIGKGKLCGSNATYQSIKSLVCASADLSSDLKQDNTGAPCDALSLAMGFGASAAKLGTVFARDPIPTECGATYSDSCP